MFPFGGPFGNPAAYPPPFYGPPPGPFPGPMGGPLGGPMDCAFGEPPGFARVGGMRGMQMGRGFYGPPPAGGPFGGMSPRRRRMSMDPGMGMRGRGGPSPELAEMLGHMNLGGPGPAQSRSRGRRFDPTKGRAHQASRSRSRGHRFDPTKGRARQRSQSRGRSIISSRARGRSPGILRPATPFGGFSGRQSRARSAIRPPFRRRRSIRFDDGVDYTEDFGRGGDEDGHKQGYSKVKQLKKGGMSESIWLLKGHADGKLYVQKTIKVNVLEGRRARAEIATLKKVKGQHHLNQIIEYRMMHNGLCSIILEYCDGGSLSDKIDDLRENGGRFSSASVWNIVMGVSRGLAYLHDGIENVHERNSRVEGWDPICHLDLKPCNIFLSSRGGQFGQSRIVLADFGCCIALSDIKRGREHEFIQICGTPAWYPPEGKQDAARRGLRPGYGTKTDMFMLGATIHVACRLLQSPSQRELDSERPCGSAYSGKNLNAMVKMLCQDDFAERPPAREVARQAFEGVRRFSRR